MRCAWHQEEESSLHSGSYSAELLGERTCNAVRDVSCFVCSYSCDGNDAIDTDFFFFANSTIQILGRSATMIIRTQPAVAVAE